MIFGYELLSGFVRRRVELLVVLGLGVDGLIQYNCWREGKRRASSDRPVV